ncbi:hypothetical protein ISS99_17010 [Dyella mobilis]|uniref:Uncharacterized protein n=1 Tax=Dyella mobilis TaxID=1849582 RepID=A0ABS2KJ83_9GAMM|nr:hypothetical protein [Dyella mobilis]
MPEQLVVVAFTNAYEQLPWPDRAPSAEGDFFVVMADSKDVSVPLRTIEWLTLSTPVALGPGVSRIDYKATDNTLSKRRVEAPVVVKGTHYSVVFLQQPGLLVQDELTRTLNCPLNLDCLIAICFIADLINKIPLPPIRLIVLVVAVLALVALGFVVVAIRAAFAGVPEPKPLSTDTNGVPIVVVPGVSVPQGLPLANVRAEDQTIALQTVKEIYWLIKQVAAG